MKNINLNKLATKIVVIFSLIMFISIISSKEAKAVCPQGTNPATMVFQDPETGCNWTINFCWQCQHFVQTHNLFFVQIESYSSDPNNIGCDNQALSTDKATKAIFSWIMMNDLCEGKPCNGEDTLWTECVLSIPLCKMYRNIYYPDINKNIVTSYGCESGQFCQKHFKFCIDYNFNPPHIHISYVGAYTTIVTQEPITPCPVVNELIPPPGKTWQDNWDSDCIQILNNCTIP